MFWLRITLAGAIACGTSGCILTGGTPGELANGSFTYECGKGDPACSLGTSGFVPAAFATGATFRIGYSRALVGMRPASPEILDEAGFGQFTFRKPGVAALLVTDGDGVLDLVHLTGADVDHLAFDGQWPGKMVSGTLHMGASDAIVVKALPRDPLDESLGGSLSYTWSSSDESVISVEPTPDDFAVNVVGHQPGAVTLTVTVQKHDFTLPVTVEASP